MLTVKSINLVGNTLPIVGKKYGVARITDVAGEMPPEFAALKYPEGKEQVLPIGDPSNSMSQVGAVYVFVEIVDKSDETVDIRIIDNYADLLSPFEFPNDVQETFDGQYFSKRCADAQLQSFDLNVEDPDSENGMTTCKAFFNIEEMAYIASEATTLVEFFRPDRLAALQSDSPVRMVFADGITKAIDVYNQINFYDKAKDFAKEISSIWAINQDGEKTRLTMSAVNDLFKMIQDNLRIG